MSDLSVTPATGAGFGQRRHGTGDRMAAAGARRAFPTGTGSEEPGALNRAADNDVEEQALRAVRTEHLRHRIREVLAALPDEQRRAIRFRLFEGRSDAGSLRYWASRRSGCPSCGIADSPPCGQPYVPTPLSGWRTRISRHLTMIVSSAGAEPHADDRSGSSCT